MSSSSTTSTGTTPKRGARSGPAQDAAQDTAGAGEPGETAAQPPVDEEAPRPPSRATAPAGRPGGHREPPAGRADAPSPARPASSSRSTTALRAPEGRTDDRVDGRTADDRVDGRTADDRAAERAADRAPDERGADGRSADGGAPRQVRLTVARVNPWSVLKISFLVSVALGVALVVAVAVLWSVLDRMGVFTDVGAVVTEVVGQEAPFDLMQVVGLGRVLSLTVVVAVVDVVLLTLLSTLAAVLYNICAALVGGARLTLTDD